MHAAVIVCILASHPSTHHSLMIIKINQIPREREFLVLLDDHENFSYMSQVEVDC